MDLITNQLIGPIPSEPLGRNLKTVGVLTTSSFGLLVIPFLVNPSHLVTERLVFVGSPSGLDRENKKPNLVVMDLSPSLKY